MNNYVSDIDDSDDDLYECTSFEKIDKSTLNVASIVSTVPSQKSVEELCEHAVQEGNLSALKELLASDPGFNINKYLPNGETALCIAAQNSYSHIVEYLLEIGADANACFNYQTPLMFACSSPSTQMIANYQCVKSLLDKGADVNIGDKYRITPLMRACEVGKLDVVNLLLQTANINMTDPYGKPAVIYAVTNGHLEIFEALAAKGACSKESDYFDNLKLNVLSTNNPKMIALFDKYAGTDEEADLKEIVTPIKPALWPDLFPEILSNYPAFYFDIPLLLNGMNCENLANLFFEKEVNLETFLTLDHSECLTELGVIMPYQRKKIIDGLFKFHKHGWKSETVPGFCTKSGEKILPQTCLTRLGSYFRIVTVLKSSIDYNIKRLISENSMVFQSPKVVQLSQNLLNEIKLVRMELKLCRSLVSKINKKNLPPADLITPNNPLSAKSFTKTKVIFGLASTAICFIIIGMKRL